MLQDFIIYYADNITRIQTMMMCSNQRIDWVQCGLSIATQKFNKIGKVKANSLSEVYNKLKVLNIDKRKKKNRRSISIGDVICVACQSWIVTSTGFQKIPQFLWNKALKGE